jgi:hypothetical protein
LYPPHFFRQLLCGHVHTSVYFVCGFNTQEAAFTVSYILNCGSRLPLVAGFRKRVNQIAKDYTIQGWVMDVDRHLLELEKTAKISKGRKKESPPTLPPKASPARSSGG